MLIFGAILVVVLVAFDQLTKFLAVKYIATSGSIVVINGIMNFTLVENRGAAFGMMQGGRWFFVVLTTVVLGGIVYYYAKLPKNKVYNYVRFALILIASGAIGNFIDRLLNGYVIDFLHVQFMQFPVFNVADCFVVCGTCLLAILLIFFVKDDDPLFGSKTEKTV